MPSMIFEKDTNILIYINILKLIELFLGYLHTCQKFIVW